MIAFISIFLAIALLGVTVYGLHRYQTMEVEYQVDRTMPLPPLERGTQPNFQERGQHTYLSTAAESNSAAEPGATHQQVNEKTKPTETARAAPAVSAWQKRVSAAKQSGDIAAAVAICNEQLPLWGAYNQLCILLRGQLKDADLQDEAALELLSRLYHTAVVAELLHGKDQPPPQLNLNQLRSKDLSQLQELDIDYQQLGYAQLRLIRKSDIKLILSAWGRPRPPIAYPVSTSRSGGNSLLSPEAVAAIAPTLLNPVSYIRLLLHTQNYLDRFSAL